MHNQALLNAQRALEEESVQLGIEKYRAALAQGEDHMPPGMRLIKQAIGPLSEKIKEQQEEAFSGKPGRHMGVCKYLTQFSTEQVAFITAQAALSGIMGRQLLTQTAIKIASALEDTINFEELKAKNARAYRLLMKKIEGSSDDGYRHIVMLRQLEYAKLDRVKWGTSEKVRLGTMLVQLMADATGLIEVRKLIMGAEDTPYAIVGTPATIEWLEKAHAHCELLHPVRLPMVCPPLPWKGPHGGGYLTRKLQSPLIKFVSKPYLEELKHWEMPMVYKAVNALQETPWKINQAILHVAQEVWSGGGCLGKMPPRDPLPLPPKMHDPGLHPEEHKAWKMAAAKVHQENVRLLSRRVGVAAKLSMAAKFSAYENLYFPHALDWRGRAYPISAILNPQGDDLTKALLMFGRGKPLGEHGATWLAVHIANCYGVDKVPFEQRVQWVLDHEEAILDSAMNPLDGGRFWCDADSPYCFLAAAMEWAGYRMQGPTFVSHLPVSWDGSCNGLQNFSAMLRDPIGGKAVNLTPNEKPSDIYGEVAREASALIDMDAHEGIEMGLFWKGKVTRKLTKRNTMTLPYGVSRFGMTDQLREEFNKMRSDGDELAPPIEMAMESARYLAAKNWDAIGRVVVAARQAMDWLMDAARVAAKDGLPVRWVTPSGLPVVQAYMEKDGERLDFSVAGRRYQLVLQVTGSKLNTRKQASGISPNFVHSLDAAHMQRTVCYCVDQGLSDFAMIHDSYGAHACDAPELSYQLRKAFVDQYEGDVLGNFRDQLAAQLPPELAAELPPVPPMGTLDLGLVMESEYFFA